MIKVLVCEDEVNIQNLYKIRLEKSGFQVSLASDGQEALEMFYQESFDLIILDIMMPKKNGIEVISEIREAGHLIPAIIVSARGELNIKLSSFEKGIDDYLIKPFEFEELLIRMKALLRRSKIMGDNRITIQDLTLDEQRLMVYDGENEVSFSKREFVILFKLLSYPERTFSKELLFEEFWGYDSDADINVVKVYISRIRNQIKCFPQIEIETIRGIGYRGIKYER